jgi:hypothetical protein
VDLRYGWESDNGVVRGVSEEELKSRSIYVYGEVVIRLKCDSVVHEIAAADVADDLGHEWSVLASALLETCRSQEEQPGDGFEGFFLKREGSRLLLRTDSWFLPASRSWGRFLDDPCLFSVDLKDFVAKFYAAAASCHSELAAALGVWGKQALASEVENLQSLEAETRKVIAG